MIDLYIKLFGQKGKSMILLTTKLFIALVLSRNKLPAYGIENTIHYL